MISASLFTDIGTVEVSWGNESGLEEGKLHQNHHLHFIHDPLQTLQHRVKGPSGI